MDERERELFEKHFGPRDSFAWRNEDGTYKVSTLQSAWKIWQARAAIAQSEAPVAAPEAPDSEQQAGAPDSMVSILQEFVDYHSKPAGMTLETALSADKLGEFLEDVEGREKAMVQRARALLARATSAATTTSASRCCANAGCTGCFDPDEVAAMLRTPASSTTASASGKLLLCPFCGNVVHETTYSGAPTISCGYCPALMGGEESSASKDELRLAWNRRAPAQQTERMQPSREAADLLAELDWCIAEGFPGDRTHEALKAARAAITQQGAAQAPTEAQEDIRIARHCLFNFKEFRAGRSTFPGEALGILENALDRLAAMSAATEQEPK
jgi:hypothetical protein